MRKEQREYLNKNVLGVTHSTKALSIEGWADENCENPKESGQYLCLVKWYNSEDYHYTILEYEKKTRCWEVTDSCEHILWTNLPPSPFR